MGLRSPLSRRIIWIILLSLIWTVLLAFNVVPQLRGDCGWRWPYEPVLDLRRIAPFILSVIIYVPVALWLLRRRSAVGLLAWAMASSVGLALGAVYIRDDLVYRLYTVTISGLTGGWHMAAAHIDDLAATLRHWPQFMTDSVLFSSHMGISPPGIVIVYYAINSILERFPALASMLARPLREMQCQNLSLMGDTNAQLASAWLGMLTPVWSSLTILPLYRLGQRVFGQEPARWSVVWWPLIPSFLIFAPLSNTFYPFLSLIMISLLLKGLRRNQTGWIVAAGLLMSILTFMTFTFTPLLLLAGLLTLGIFLMRRTSARLPWHWPLQMGMWFGLGLSAVWLVFYAVTGQGVWDVWQVATQAHLALHRSYWPWLILHLNDFFMFTGWPLILLAGVSTWLVLQKLFARKELVESDIVILAAGLTVIILDLSGMLRGESGRILLFLSPWLLLAAASALDRDEKPGWVLTATQGIVAIVMIVCLRVLDTEFVRPPSTPPCVAEIAANAQIIPSGVLFGDTVRLQAFSGRIESRPDAEGRKESVLVLWLNWEPLRPMDIPYYLAVLPVAPDGQVATAATLQQPFKQLYPTTCWKPSDKELRDEIQVPLFKTQPGDWWVSLVLVDGKTGQGLEVLAPDGSRDHQVGLGPFR